MKLSIIIVNYRSWSVLEQSLECLQADPDFADWEVIVVDNDSRDGQLEPFAARHPAVQFVASHRNGGFAYGCNLGARRATSPWLLFMNPDVLPEPGTIGALLDCRLAHPAAHVLGASQVNAQGQPQKSWDIFPDGLLYFKSIKSLMRKLLPSRFPNPRHTHDGLILCDWISGSVVLISRDDFDALAGWSEDYWMYAEDCDLCYRATAAGLGVACTTAVSMVHLHGAASRQNLEVTILTKAEAIISKHVFNHRHRRGLRRWLNHCWIILASLPELMFWSLLDLLSFRRIRVLRIRSGMLKALLIHYRQVRVLGDWRSSQARAGLEPSTDVAGPGAG